MIRAEWTVAKIGDPVVGSAECEHVTAAWQAVEEAFRAAFAADWSPEHERGLRTLEQAVMWDSRAALADSGRFEFSVPAVVVTLEQL